MTRRRLQVLTLATAVAVGLGLGLAPASASTGDLGHDVSYPNCSSSSPGGSFLVVGVNGGQPFGANPCLSTESSWAATTGRPQLYVNTANPGASQSTHWPSAGTGYCVNASSDNDAGCSYEYGRKAAAAAVTTAKSDVSSFVPLSVTWWLDVEGSRTAGQPGNSWVGSGKVNAATLQGFVDGLRSAGVPEVGVYTTAFQWNDITEGYTRSTSNSYRTAWPFPALFPIEDGPVWIAGTSTTYDNTVSQCAAATAVTGGELLLSQYGPTSGIDDDYRCREADHVVPTVTTTAPARVVTTASTVGVAWNGADSGSGLASFDVQYRRAAYNSGFTAWTRVAQRTAARSLTSQSPSRGTTACWSTRSRDAAGNTSGWSYARCTSTPLDDRDLSASAGWGRYTGAHGYFLGSFTSTTRYGATLTRTGLRTSRLNLIALRCSTCGKVAVYLNGAGFTTVNLQASTSSLAVIPLPRFSLRSATVTLKVVTSGRTVRIDGLATGPV
ncbi:MAG: hypothetical protein WCD35_04470 [Mycobacteriales bacterium]